MKTNVFKLGVVAFVSVAIVLAGCKSETKPPAKPAAKKPVVKKPKPPTMPAVEEPAPPAKPAVEEPAPPTKPAVETPAPAPAGDFEAFKKQSPLPVLRVPVLAQAPVIDGKMDDAYKQATPVSLVFLDGSAGKPKAATTAYVVSTAKELVMFFNCESPNMDAIKADIKQRDGQVWKDDCIELFIDPTNRRTDGGVMHIMINSLGTTAECTGPERSEDYSWNPDIRARTDKGKTAWTLEVAIPFSDLTNDPKKINRVWAVNLNRMAYLPGGTEDTAWCKTDSNRSHVPGKFGCLWLDAGTVDNTK